MKTIINRVFAKKEGPSQASAPHSAVSSELTNSDLENYYLRIIVDSLRRMLVPSDTVEVGVKRAGVGPCGLTSFAGYVRILKWDAVVTPVLLQNMPAIDARIRRVVDASVILEHTHFAGLWFQATSATDGAPKALFGLPAEIVRQPGT
jgi:hypothetical protein